MQPDWFALLLVLAGGIIGVSSGLLTAILSNALTTKKARRDELLSAYVEWVRSLYHAVHEAESLWLYDGVRKLKKAYSKELGDIPSSPSGRTREQHVMGFSMAVDELRAAEARLLLLERRPELRRTVGELSNLQLPDSGLLVDTLDYIHAKRTGLRQFLDLVGGQAAL